MALPHARPGEVIDVQPLGGALADTPSHALIRTPRIELIRSVLKAGESLPPHAVEGEVTLHCIEGRVRVQAQAGQLELRGGQLVLLPGRDVHALTAIEPASLLVTLLRLPPDVKDQDASGTG